MRSVQNIYLISTYAQKNIAIATLALSSSLAISSSSYAVGITTLVDFNNTNGAEPTGSLVIGNDGLLYGTTNGTGGGGSAGTIYSLNPNGNVFTNLVNFNGTNGAIPTGLSLNSASGVFYGTTPAGGPFQGGTIFSFNPNGNTFTPNLVNFIYTSTKQPVEQLTFNSDDGLFYGVAAQGFLGLGGIYSFNPNGNVFSSLAGFDGINGNQPRVGLTKGNDGLLYGSTTSGGSIYDAGTIYSFNPNGNIITHLATFTPFTGSFGANKLTLANNGLFYGTSSIGGANNFGTVFSFNPNGNVLTKLADFDAINGVNPSGELTFSNGLFYGTAELGGGGNNGQGTIYSFNPDDNVITKLATFDGSNGRDPRSGLTLASNGLFYGTTISGGANGLGTLFSFDAGLNQIAVPEPFTILGTLTALGLGASLKRKLK